MDPCMVDGHESSHSMMDLSDPLSLPMLAFPEGNHQPVGSYIDCMNCALAHEPCIGCLNLHESVGSCIDCSLSVLGGGDGIGAENQELWK